VKIVGARLGHNIDGSSGSSPKVRAVVAAINLKLLHRVLANRKALASAIAGRLTTVDRYAVSSAIAAVEGKTACRR